METKRRLSRSTSNKVVGGVCGGVGQYLGVDPILVRLLFVLLFVAEGAGLLIYLVLWLIMPRDDQEVAAGVEANVRAGAGEMAGAARAAGEGLKGAVRSGNSEGAVTVGIGLMILGLFFLLRNLDFVALRWLDAGLLWPIFFIVAGVLLLGQRLKLQS
jgi:phage shock protein C